MGNNKKVKVGCFSRPKSKLGPSSSDANPVAGSSHHSVASLEIQQPVATKGRYFLGRWWGRSRSCSPVLVTSTPSPAPDLGLAPAPNIQPVVELVPGTTPERESVASANLTLWQKALDKIAEEDKVGVGLNAGNLLRNLIDSTQEKKMEIEQKQWVYKNKEGETVAYADRFLTLLNKYVCVVDIAIQHDPHVVALVWSGFRFLLQVSLYEDMYDVWLVFANSCVLSRSLPQIWRM